MSKEIFLSSSFSDHTRRACEWLESSNAREVLVVSNRWGAADDFAHQYAHRRGGHLGLHRFTLLQLATELASRDMAAQGLSPLTALGFQALCARTAHWCHSRDRLEYLQPVAGTPGFVRSLATTLREVRLQGLVPETLAAGGAPGRDLAELLRRFELELRERKLADFALVFRLAAAAAAEQHRFQRVPLLLLSLRVRNLAEKNFLSGLAGQADAVLALVLEGDDTSRSLLEAALGAATTNERARELASETAAEEDRLHRLRRFLFTLDSAAETPGEEDRSVEFFSEPGEGRECVEIARRIRFAAEAGVRFDRLAILLRDPDTYLPLVEDALHRAGIPGHFTHGTMRPDPAGRAFLALLECAAENLSASRFAEYLSLGQAPLPDQRGAPPRPTVPWVEPQDEQLCFKTALERQGAQDPLIPNLETDPVIAGNLRTPAQWEQLLVEASVIGGLERWRRRLQGLAAEWELQSKILQEGSAEERRLRERQRRLSDLQQFALPLVERLSGLPPEATWSKWIEILEQLAVSAVEKADSVLELLAELRPMGEVGPVSLHEVHRVLGDRLTLLRSRPDRDRYGQVLVATPEEVAGRSFEWVFLPGLAEGLFPKKALEDPLLLDEARTRVGLESALEQRRRAERLRLRMAVGAATSRLVISYSRMDLQQGRSRVPSFYALDIVRAAEGYLPDVHKLEKQAARASSTRLGWPAPRQPERAIDDAEYDLAVLEPLLKNPEPAPGTARFLLDVNQHLARSLRGRWLRWVSRRFNPADGLVEPVGKTRELLEQESLKKRSYSPTSLQNFAACPYKFFLYALQGLETRDEAVAIEQMDPLTRGALFHTVQFELLSALRSRGQLPIRDHNEAEALEQAAEILHRVTRQYEDKLAPAIPRIWRTEVTELESDLRGWIREQATDRSDWTPERFEFSFGLPRGPERDPESRAETARILNDFQVRGSVDLLEHSSSRGTYRVTDHKTGRAPQEKSVVVKGGELLQPLVYSLAVESLLGEPVEVGRLFYCTQRGDFRTLQVTVDSVNCDRLKTVLEIIEEAIVGGFLPAAPNDKACSFCDYRLICGPHEDKRSQRKDAQALARLYQLRALP